MVEPTVITRSEHTISRRDIDPDALRVLYRLKHFHHAAYLVGGSVRDLLLGRLPKDFDIGTSAHPYEIKRLFRNCWIIGRRFRLAHVKFGPKTIEVATFRRQVPPGTETVPPVELPPAGTGDARPDRHRHGPGFRENNTFGTPEEDAFRRDFTINALFYDIATFSIIDYVGGLADLHAGLIRSMGDPNERFLEDPVRMLRAIALAARLGFQIDDTDREAITRHRAAIGLASPARLLDEYYKVLRSGAATGTFRGLAEAGLLEHVSPEIHKGSNDAFWASLERLDAYRRRFESIPDTLTNAVLLGSLVVPLDMLAPRTGAATMDDEGGETPRVVLGRLPLARRDVEQLRQLLQLQSRLHDPDLSPRARRTLILRGAFGDALTWLEIHGDSPDTLERWRHIGADPQADAARDDGARRRRRSRRRRRRGPRRPDTGPQPS